MIYAHQAIQDDWMIAYLFSGGKDLTLSLHNAHDNGTNVELLITMISENEFSYMFHRPNINLSSMQARALGILQAVYKTKGEKDKSLWTWRRH